MVVVTENEDLLFILKSFPNIVLLNHCFRISLYVRQSLLLVFSVYLQELSLNFNEFFRIQIFKESLKHLVIVLEVVDRNLGICGLFQ